MSGTFTILFIATVLFVGGHFLISNTPTRDTLIARIGEGPYKGLYSLIMIALLVWMIWTFKGAPYILAWNAPIGLRHLPLTVMPIAFILVIAAQMRGNPATIGSPTEQLSGGPKGIFTVTRHPMLWGIALWAALHMAAMGDVAAIIFFGGFIVLALGGTLLIDHKKRKVSGSTWTAYEAASSNIPFVAAIGGRTKVDWRGIGWSPVVVGVMVYVVFLILHETLIGVAPAAFVSGLI